MKAAIKSSLTYLKKFKIEPILFSKDVLAIFSLFVCLLFAYGLFSLYTLSVSQKEMGEKIEHIYVKIKRLYDDQVTKEEYLRFLKETDVRYVSHAIEERLPFSKEAELLEQILSFSAFKTNKALQKRLDLLQRKESPFALIKKSSKILHPLSEVLYALNRSVYVNTSDVKALLSRVEGVYIDEERPLRGRPDMHFKVFDLKKERDKEGEEQYELFFEIISKEAITKLLGAKNSSLDSE